MSISGTDHFTLALGDNEAVPIAITVKVDIGFNAKVPTCWLNSGEQVIRGPIVAPQFRISHLLWIKHREFDITKCDLDHTKLPPPRPYKPSQEDIDRWWDDCQPWIDANLATHRGLTLARLDLTGLAPPKYGVE